MNYMCILKNIYDSFNAFAEGCARATDVFADGVLLFVFNGGGPCSSWHTE